MECPRCHQEGIGEYIKVFSIKGKRYQYRFFAHYGTRIREKGTIDKHVDKRYWCYLGKLGRGSKSISTIAPLPKLNIEDKIRELRARGLSRNNIGEELRKQGVHISHRRIQEIINQGNVT